MDILQKLTKAQETLKEVFLTDAQKKVNEILSGIIQNRVVSLSLLSETLLILLSLPFLFEEKMILLLSILPVPLCIHPSYVTGKAYRETKESISKTGGFETYMYFATRKHRDQKRYLEYFIAGYCELQGIYLAAKDAGMEEEFFRLKHKLTHNCIPNF